MKGLIIGSGEIKNFEYLKQLVKENDYIVCADGGVNHLLKIGKFPNIVIGDLDSIGEIELKILKKENIKIEKFSTIKDESDTELCVNYMLEKNIKNITLVGVTGRRLDHTLANIYLLKKIYKLGAKASIVDDKNRIFYLEESITLRKNDDYFISIIPTSEEGAIISLVGFLYPLNKESLQITSTRGLSNKIIEDKGKIIIHSGKALVIESKD